MAVLMLIIVSLGYAHAQVLQVKGKVTDSTGGAVVGASVQVKGTSTGAVTGLDGTYSIQAKKGSTLVFSFIGYETVEVRVTKEKIDVRFSDSVACLEEMVVVAYGTSHKQKELTGAVSRVNKVSLAYMPQADYAYANSEEYKSNAENRFRLALKDPLSTFSIDVDAASYSNMRRFVNQGQLPPAESIRTEELINYFTYNYAKPTGSDPVKITTEVGACPWNGKHRLVRIGLKAKEIAGNELPASNLVFLIDVSGSMYGPTRLELVKSSLKLLVNNLREKDRVAIVVYAGSAGEVLPSTSGADKQKIREALDKLTAGGSTAGGAGIQLAYNIARKNLISGGNNRIILCTDGDFNVGVSSSEGLESMIERERKSGVFLTVLGYGMGNYKDNKMQVLAEKGNGNHAYIDNLQEANKVLVNEFGGTLFTVAKDVKLQIEFNPAKVQAYRLVGYESRLLNDEDFNDDTKDAGEMGAGHTVTAFYEVVPVGVESQFVSKIDELKYQKPSAGKSQKDWSAEKGWQPGQSQVAGESVELTSSQELLTVKLRYKQPDGETSKKMEVAVVDRGANNVSTDFRFAAAVAMFGQLLRVSDFKGDATYDKVIALAKNGLDDDEQGYRREFVRMVQTVKSMGEPVADR